jgi:hypothetical protein
MLVNKKNITVKVIRNIKCACFPWHEMRITYIIKKKTPFTTSYTSKTYSKLLVMMITNSNTNIIAGMFMHIHQKSKTQPVYLTTVIYGQYIL